MILATWLEPAFLSALHCNLRMHVSSDRRPRQIVIVFMVIALNMVIIQLRQT
jgi:hypothetical protein